MSVILRMSTLSALALVVVSALSSSVYAATPLVVQEVDDTKEFKELFLGSFDEMKDYLPPEVKALVAQATKTVMDALPDLQVKLVPDVLKIKVNEHEQVCTAKNFSDRHLILVNATRWSQIQDKRVKSAIAQHEIYSLVGLESSGHYQYTIGYLDAVQFDPSAIDLETGDDLRPTLSPEMKPILCRELGDRMMMQLEDWRGAIARCQPPLMGQNLTLYKERRLRQTAQSCAQACTDAGETQLATDCVHLTSVADEIRTISPPECLN